MKLRTLRWAVPVTLTGSTGVWIWANMHREFMTNFYLEQPYVKEPVEKILVKHKGAKIVLGSDIKKAEPSMEMSFYGTLSKSICDLNQDTFLSDSPYLVMPVEGSDGHGNFNIRLKCDDSLDWWMGRKNYLSPNENIKECCHVERADLQIFHSKNVPAEKYQNNLLLIYNRDRDGPLEYEKTELKKEHWELMKQKEDYEKSINWYPNENKELPLKQRLIPMIKKLEDDLKNAERISNSKEESR